VHADDGSQFRSTASEPPCAARARSAREPSRGPGGYTVEEPFGLPQKNVIVSQRWSTWEQLCLAVITWTECTRHRRRRQWRLARLAPIGYEALAGPLQPEPSSPESTRAGTVPPSAGPAHLRGLRHCRVSHCPAGEGPRAVRRPEAPDPVLDRAVLCLPPYCLRLRQDDPRLRTQRHPWPVRRLPSWSGGSVTASSSTTQPHDPGDPPAATAPPQFPSTSPRPARHDGISSLFAGLIGCKFRRSADRNVTELGTKSASESTARAGTQSRSRLRTPTRSRQPTAYCGLITGSGHECVKAAAHPISEDMSLC
jgi:hypothetical protein